MTRRRAREAAVRLIYAQAASLQDPDALVDEYFEPEHLATLQDEEGAIAEAPGDEELAYIRSLVRLSTEPGSSWTSWCAAMLTAGGRSALRAPRWPCSGAR